jgi:prepilin-type N-terminal cleavage/methylation domain-containing protein/prepilin-type processing-associated H-X9-DG protein
LKSLKFKIARNRNIKKGFTLVELLVTVVVVTLLSGLILSVFGRARNASRRVACSSNLRQIGMAYQMYVQDARDKFPPFIFSTDENCGWADIIYPYTRSIDVFHCPSFEYGEFRKGCPPSEDTSNENFPINTWDGSYDLNYFAGPHGRSATYIHEPASTILICDGTGRKVFFAEDGGGDHINRRDFTVLGDRHNNGVNAYFADGHVKWMKNDSLVDANLWKARK